MTKLTVFLSLFFVVQLSANVYSQTKLSVDSKNRTVKEVLLEIEDQSEFRFFYNEKFIDLNRRVKFDIDKQSIEEVMDSLFDSSDVTYKIQENNLIIITPDESKQDKTVSGEVTDNDGQPLPGVTVLIKGTTNGTVTNADGSYTLGNIPENATLVFSFVGMKTQEISVGNQTSINISLEVDAIGIEEVMAIGYGTMKKSDLTGSVQRVKGEDFKTQSMTQVTDMLTGTIAGFNADQGTTARGGASMEIRGPTSLTAGTSPLIVLDGVIFNGNLSDINPYDIESVDILKDASSAAVFGSKAASGVMLITTTKGKTGRPTINLTTKLGIAENYNERRGLGPEEYVQFRQDFFRQMFPEVDYNFYTHPDNLPGDITIDEWRNLSSTDPLDDNLNEWMARLRFFPTEQQNYLAGRTMDMYDEVFRIGFRQEYDLSINGGTENATYYWSIGYNDNEGIRVGDKYSSIRSRINADFKITGWLNAGVNAQFSDRDESSVPASMNFYVNSPYGQMFDEKGYLMRYPHGHSDNPLLANYRVSLLNKTNTLFANLYAEIKFPYGIKFKVSFQPDYRSYKYLTFTTIDEKLGGVANEESTGERRESSTMNWMIDNLLTWNKELGIHNLDVTLLANIEENRYWSSEMSNKNFSPNQQLIYHGLHFGDSPEIYVNDTRSTGDALMARVNYTVLDRYLLTASVRRDGYSAFGVEHPRAVFPALAVGWVLSEEEFFNVELINRLKLRASWGVNGNRDIGMYAALATTGSSLWYDGDGIRVGVYNSTLANSGLKWERTTALNLGFDISLLENRIDFSADVYDMTTTDLLMDRILPRVTGFNNITSNLGELENRGFEMTLNTKNISQTDFSWNSSLVFSLNRNKITKLFGDYGTYTLLGEERTGDVPDFTNQWFPGEAIDVVWDYDVIGIWQLDEAEEAAKYLMQPGDFKANEIVKDSRYVDLDDKQFIGHTEPRFRVGLRNDFSFLKNFTASIFLRAELGHIRPYSVALNGGYESNDRWNRNNGPVPYWTADNPNNEYARLNVNTGGYGGKLMIYKPASFLRVQDLSLSYNLPSSVIQAVKLNNLQVFGSIRNLATFTKWPGWDPESGMSPMPRTFTIGLNCSL
ncbi:TonB-dependent receptor [Draconibacterium sp.]|nr:TonB-dependent receptor [Draconibacterium sp.]